MDIAADFPFGNLRFPNKPPDDLAVHLILRPEQTMVLDMITNQELQQLQQTLALVDLTAERAESAAEDFRLLVAQFDHIKVQMYQERGPHKQPHFHIEFKREYRATYAINTLERIIGYMPKRYEAPVIEWARQYQTQLANCWARILAGDGRFHLELNGSATSHVS